MMMKTTLKKEKPNWLLYGLIAVSVAIHAGVFLQTSGRFNFKKPAYIEIGVRRDLIPQTRQIPKPRVRQAVPEMQQRVAREMMPDHTEPVLKPLPDVVPNLNFDASVPESAAVPEDIPEDVPPDIAAFSLPAIEETGGFGSRMDYLDMVRLKIESRKEYPPFSRQRNIEGLVTVEFMITPDGTVSGLTVVKGSGFPSLDSAAILAVNRAVPFPPPPEKYFSRQVRVKVPIAFELIQ